MKIFGIIFILIFITSCQGIWTDDLEFKKTSEHIYYNMSSDTIKQIKLELKLSENGVNSLTYDSLIINKEILPGDSLLFNYNNRNYAFHSNYIGNYTTIYFKNLKHIKNNMVDNSEFSGYSSDINGQINLLYIGNTKLLYCFVHKKDSPYSWEVPSCDLNLLNEE